MPEPSDHNKAYQNLTSDEILSLAISHHQAGEVKTAEDLYCQIIKQTPENADAFHLLGLLYYQSERAQQALDLISKAISINSSIALFHANLALILKEQGRIRNSIDANIKAVQLCPQNFAYWGNLLFCLEHLDISQYDANLKDILLFCMNKDRIDHQRIANAGTALLKTSGIYIRLINDVYNDTGNNIVNDICIGRIRTAINDLLLIALLKKTIITELN